jgi:hypothetical protein
MLLAALVCGLVTAYYYGVRIGAAAAGLTLGLFVVGAAFPAVHLLAYLVVAAGLVGVTALGARRPRDPGFARALDVGKRLLARVWKR